MGKIIRWWREFRAPSLKCGRLGHLRIVMRRRGRMLPGEHSFRSVADNVVQERPQCARCHGGLGDWAVVSRDSIQSLTMPDDMWRRLKENGALWDEYWKVT
ncbi:hypothetical protein LCGC14_1347120 [marine sediment metagenome]|uniref:Uncharacterized protein n=1 Tax=marine sediment metagenome TaxID=412755 RepID=A0A0F9MSQ2_9ZZZZ